MGMKTTVTELEMPPQFQAETSHLEALHGNFTGVRWLFSIVCSSHIRLFNKWQQRYTYKAYGINIIKSLWPKNLHVCIYQRK